MAQGSYKVGRLAARKAVFTLCVFCSLVATVLHCCCFPPLFR